MARMTPPAPPAREAGGYEYLTDTFERVHTTSTPKTDQEALDDFPMVQGWFDHDKSVRVTYITRRSMDDYKYVMMPFKYDPATQEVTPIEGNRS